MCVCVCVGGAGVCENGILKMQVKSLKNPATLQKMNFSTHIFQGFQLILFQNAKNAYFSKHLSMAASVKTCNNSHTCIFNFLENGFHSYYSFLLILTLIFLRHIVFQLSQSSNIIFSNKMFHLYQISNAPSENIDSFQFWVFSAKNHIRNRGFTFQMERASF